VGDEASVKDSSFSRICGKGTVSSFSFDFEDLPFLRDERDASTSELNNTLLLLLLLRTGESAGAYPLAAPSPASTTHAL
jgi:hypothetical protein